MFKFHAMFSFKLTLRKLQCRHLANNLAIFFESFNLETNDPLYHLGLEDNNLHFIQCVNSMLRVSPCFYFGLI